MKNKILCSAIFLLTVTFLFAQKSGKKNSNFHTFLGVDVDNNSVKTNGLYINGVYKGYAAEKAGLKRGDSLMAINSHPVYNFDELVKTLDKYDPGTTIEVLVIRNNQPQKISATISEYPEFLKYNSMQWLKEMNANESKEGVRRAKLGVDVEPVWERYAVKVSEVVDNSGASKAGIQTGDLILKMDNYEFATMEELKYYLSKYNPGDIVTLSVLHNGEIKSIKVSLGEEIIYPDNKKEKNKEKKDKDNRS
jgi:S1-C subfamily serine protease